MLKFSDTQVNSLEARHRLQFEAEVATSLHAEVESFADVHPMICLALTRNAILRAGTYGLSTQADLMLFVHLMAEVSSGFDLVPEIHQALTRTDTDPDDRLDRLVAEADAVTWAVAAADTSTMGWYLQVDTFGQPEARRMQSALEVALPEDDLPPQESRLMIVEDALEQAAGLALVDHESRLLLAACCLAYGRDFRSTQDWAGDVFAPDASAHRIAGMLRVRLALDFGAWL